MDPFDDAGRSQAGFVVTASGLRVPVAAPTSVAAWSPAAAAVPPATTRAGTNFKGVGPKGYRRTDQRIREQVCDRLLLDPYLDASRIVVRVVKGRVSLSGSVPTERMRESATAVASSVAAGVVDTTLQVTGGTTGRAQKSQKSKKSKKSKTGRRREPSKRKRGGGR
jgi:hypothetical protein